MVQDIISKAVTQLAKKYLVFLWNPKVHYRVHKITPPDSILNHANPVHPVDRYLPKFHFNVILLPTPRSFQCSLTFRPSNQNPLNISPLRKQEMHTVFRENSFEKSEEDGEIAQAVRIGVVGN
jgi:hypothetical protein